MVKSRLNPSIDYPNIKHIYPEDNKKKSFVYETSLYGIDVMIVIGEVKNTYASKNVLYFPVYLVKSNNKVVQIGLFEVFANEYFKLMDKEEFEDNLGNDPLLYDFATTDFIKKNAKQVLSNDESSDESSDSDDDSSGEDIDEEDIEETINIKVNNLKIPSYRRDIFTPNTNTIIPSILIMETAQDARNIRHKYHEKSDDIWIKKWLKNKYYSIKDNKNDTENGGDCLFAIIRDAFEQIGQETTISQIRKKLSSEITEATYLHYKEQYEMYNSAIKNTTTESIKLKKQVEMLQTQLKDTISMDQKRKIAVEGTHIKQIYELLKKENQLSKELLNEFNIMKNIKSLAEFKEKITTCAFWADDWAINTLERILNIKFIMLSSKRYSEKNFTSVLQCMDIIDPVIEEKKIFEPEFYIIVEHTGEHYRLIGFKKKYIFTFSELPYDIKIIIIDKCLQKESGVYAFIPDFISFKYSLMGIGPGISNKPLMDDSDMEYLTDSKLNNLFDENIVFGIDIHCSSNIIPGRGRSEKIEPVIETINYVQLYSTPDWRKKLSREYTSMFELDGHKWNSVEHYYQANKFTHHPEFYLDFSLDSKKESATDVELAKALGGKEGKYKGQQVRKEMITIIPDFYGKKQKEILKKGHRAKFTQNEELKQLLLFTQRAKLLRLQKARPPEIYDELMIIRNEMK